MAVFAIDLNDRALAFASGGRVLSCAPSAVFDGTSPNAQGAEAIGAQAWGSLRRSPMTTSTRHVGDLARADSAARSLALLAAELSARLEEQPVPPGANVWVAAPAAVPPHALGLLLGAAPDIGLPIAGFIDAAVVSAAVLGLDRPALALDLGLHHIGVTALEAGGEVRRRAVLTNERSGLLEIYQAWLALASTVFVKRLRFDPLHQGASEQQLFDALSGAAQDATRRGEASVAIERNGARLEVTVSRDQLAQKAEPVYREIVRLLHALRPAGAPLALMVPRIALELPGLHAALREFNGCELIALADGFAAAACSTLELPDRESAERVALVRRLPTRFAPECAALATRELLRHEVAPAREPTHVLYAGKAYLLGRQTLTVGRLSASDHTIALAEGLAGVSRRHCTFLREAAETVLVDHSRHGTFVNGERVFERVRVHAGDRVRLGEPGVELALIAVGGTGGDSHAAPASN
jgi:hypothetical protein